MKLLRFFFLIVPFLGSAQNDEVKTLSAVGINAGLDILHPSDFSYSAFQNTLPAPDFTFESELAEQVTPERLYSRQSLSAYVRLRIGKTKQLGVFDRFNVQVGGIYSAGQNLSYEFSETRHHVGDSVYLTENSQTNTYTRDTIFTTRTSYNSYMKNVGLSSEILMSTGKKSSSFTCGVGASFQMSMSNAVRAAQITYYESALFDTNGQAAYYEANENGEMNYSNDFGLFTQEHKLNTNYLLTTYLPFKFEAIISDKPFWSQLSMEFTGKVGYEMLFGNHQIFSGRLAYGLGVGVNYYL